MDRPLGVGLVGARGYAGRELLALVASHPRLSLAFAASRSRAGHPVVEAVPNWPGEQVFLDASPATVAEQGADVVVLALPNGHSAEYAAAVASDTVVVDLSADHRFDDDWVYGLPELHRDDLLGATRIANPGCYATAAMLALAPVASMLAAEPSVFGVSGYSGAGTEPSPKNDETLLRDNVMPYHLTGHLHEQEISHQLGRRVRFAPSVAPFERGLVVTVLAELRDPTDVGSLADIYSKRFGDDPLVAVQADVPLPRDAAGKVGATIGGFSVDADDPRRVGVAVTLDNLLKGAASQAVQNINRARGLGDLAGLLSAD
ncbi:MAG: N-acetyl-gamma-glutamyl-phosphate reductase [Acidimicrobiia bacterium]